MNILIIGATSGIGAALAQEYLSLGHTVGITGRRQEHLDKLAKHHTYDRLHTACCDATAQNWEQALELIVSEMGGIDLFIFSAGVGELNKHLDLAKELPTIHLNVTAFTQHMLWAAAYFKEKRWTSCCYH